ncbi:MAG: hypothetical protein ACI9VI_003268 [Candidatus Azotimanducaceae bacterium]|jgi:hypothetical protein
MVSRKLMVSLILDSLLGWLKARLKARPVPVITLWVIIEAFACQTIYCRDKPGIVQFRFQR